MPDELFGLPTHPLVVHGAVVLVPLAAVGALVCLLPQVRRHLGVAVFVLSIAALVAVIVAQESGGSLQERVDETDLVDQHVGMGNTVLPWVIVLLVGAAGLVALDVLPRQLTRTRARSSDTAGADSSDPGAPSWLRPAAIVVAIVVVIGAAGSIERIVEVGHSGAKAAWQEVDLNGGPAGK